MDGIWMREIINVYRFLFKNLKGTDLLEYLTIDERIILKWSLQIQNGRMWTEHILLTIETNGGVGHLLAFEEGQCSMVVDRILSSPQRISHRREELRWRIMMGIFGLREMEKIML